MRLLAILLLLLAAPAVAQTVVSDGPDSVAVTIYRDPSRGAGGAIDLDNLSGFALITETRRIRLPRGPAEIRFEGVAEGIVPVSAIVTGLPGGTIQRNRDANLLSPASLVDGSLGNRVFLRRTNPETGDVREQEAVIRAGPGDGVIFQTAEGIEALRCAGLPETIVYDDIPPGLSAKPTLSVRTVSPEAATATVTLSYLASGFDWTAHYVADIRADGATIDLLAWLTLANSNPQGFERAEVQAVAGTLSRVVGSRMPEGWQQLQLNLTCWPMDTTATYPRVDLDRMRLGRLAENYGEDIVVTGSRLQRPDLESVSPVTVVAEQEDLGDLKLYRIPERVTVAANAQKQVALLVQPGVRFERIYRGYASLDAGRSAPEPLELVLRADNESAQGLGVAMPSGTVTMFETAGGSRLPFAETRLADTAVGEDVELAVAVSPQVMQTTRVTLDKTGHPREWIFTVSNANPAPIAAELDLGPIADRPLDYSSAGRVIERDGRRWWAFDVPANGEIALTARLQ